MQALSAPTVRGCGVCGRLPQIPAVVRCAQIHRAGALASAGDDSDADEGSEARDALEPE
jgi:hypothetical protein